MKIAIAGTRGIPNNYGGFEQCAEYLSVLLAARGHQVTVYNTHYHPYQDKAFKGAIIHQCFNPEKNIGTVGNFLYDFFCMRHAIRHRHDVLLVLGYTTASVFYPFMRYGNTVLVTNMDGLEWKRDKWNRVVKRLAHWFEHLGAQHSHHLVADNIKIKEYLKEKYGKDAFFIPYGCHLFTQTDDSILESYSVTSGIYSILIARMEAENNVSMILEGYSSSAQQGKLLVVGNVNTPYGRKLAERFGNDPRIVFTGGIYDINHLNNLRHFSEFYFHGHSVGGTNPSLLEAMACRSYIVAHGNEFNRAILGTDARYFNSADSLTKLLNESLPGEEARREAIAANTEKVKSIYHWPLIADQYEAMFMKVTGR